MGVGISVGGTRISPPTRALISTYVAVPAPTKFVKSIVADWTCLIEILELVCPHAVILDVVIKLVRVRRQFFGHTILVPGEGIIFLLGVSDARGLHTKKEISGGNRSYLGEFRYFVDRRILKDPWRDASKQALKAIEAF